MGRGRGSGGNVIKINNNNGRVAGQAPADRALSLWLWLLYYDEVRGCVLPSACTLNMNSRPLLCLLRIPLPAPLPQDCGDACAASGECALLRGSKLLVFAEADEPMERINLDDEVRGCVREGVALGLGHCVRVNGDAFKIKNGFVCCASPRLFPCPQIEATRAPHRANARCCVGQSWLFLMRQMSQWNELV